MINLLIKLFTLTSLLLIWIGLNEFDTSTIKITFLIIAPLAAFCFAAYIRMLPKYLKFKISFVFYFFWLIKEIFKSTLSVIKIVWRRNIGLSAAFEWIEPKSYNDISLTVYGNSITLTPGTVTIDIKNNMLLVHALKKSYIDDLKEGEMEKRIIKVLSLSN